MYQDIDLTFDSQVVEVNLVCGRLPELTRFFFFWAFGFDTNYGNIYRKANDKLFVSNTSN